MLACIQSRDLLLLVRVLSSLQGHGRSGTLSDHYQAVLQAGTGEQSLKLPSWATVAFILLIAPFFCVDSCPGHHLCIRRHKQAVLSAPGQVGQWCGWSKTISTLIPLPFTVTQYLYYPSVCCWCSLHTQWLSVSDKMMKSLISVLSVLSFLLLFCSSPQTWCRGFWSETSLMRSSGGRCQRTKEARFDLNLILWLFIMFFCCLFLHLTYLLSDNVVCRIL